MESLTELSGLCLARCQECGRFHRSHETDSSGPAFKGVGLALWGSNLADL